jgi:transcriptional regulator with XRE-family HTH domain
MTNKQPHPIDRLVGLRVRMFRTAQGLSQSRLAENLGITFQQVQKYENGSNRISASRLFEISRVLGVTIVELYGGADDAIGGPVNGTVDKVPSMLDHKIIRALSLIDDDHVKRKVLALIQTLAPETADADM